MKKLIITFTMQVKHTGILFNIYVHLFYFSTVLLHVQVPTYVQCNTARIMTFDNSQIPCLYNDS
jgi:hypothetical protein